MQFQTQIQNNIKKLIRLFYSFIIDSQFYMKSDLAAFATERPINDSENLILRCPSWVFSRVILFEEVANTARRGCCPLQLPTMRSRSPSFLTSNPTNLTLSTLIALYSRFLCFSLWEKRQAPHHHLVSVTNVINVNCPSNRVYHRRYRPYCSHRVFVPTRRNQNFRPVFRHPLIPIT